MEQNNATPTYKLNVKRPNIISLIVLCAFASMGAIVITPALQSIANYFKISASHAQLTVTSFLLGYTIGQLIYGPLANRFGRKPAFYIGIAIATIGSIISILSSFMDSFYLMIIGRLFEALGSSVGLVVCFTIINDFYFPSQARKMTGFLVLAFAIVPGIAITLGGLITEFASWKICFYFLFCYGLLLIIPAAILPETITTYDSKALNIPHLIKIYFSMFKNSKLALYALICGLSSAIVYVFSAEGPLIGIHILGYHPALYGIIGLIPYLGTICGALLTVRYAQRVSGTIMITLGIILETTASLIMFISFLYHFVNIYILIAPMILLCVGHGLLAGNSSALAMLQSDDKSNASSIVNFLTVGVAVIGTFILTRFSSQNIIVMPSIFLSAVILMILFLIILVCISKVSTTN
jgi:DHA1 family bicyclomycin/chloramphenicol resistance-like MFS transporter